VASDSVYLRSDLNFEPLINSFYAWLHSASPAPAALNLAKNFLPILKSYLAAPEVHARAARNPATKGGPFADIRSVSIEDVRLLFQSLVSENESVLAFADAIGALDVRLVEGATGNALGEFYATLPSALAGFVELAYDTHHRATITFNEALLYRAMFDRCRHAVAVSIASSDDRPFVLSSPRLASPDVLLVATPLDGCFYDEVDRAQKTPATMAEHCERLGIDREAPVAASLFTPERSRHDEVWRTGPVGVRYFGHASVMFALGEKVVAVDPMVSAWRSNDGRFSYEDVPETIDVCLITHGHQDHLVTETLLRLRPRIRTVVVPRAKEGNLQDPSLRRFLEALGFSSVVEVRPFDSMRVGDVEVTALPFLGEHADLDIAAKTTYLIRMDDTSIYVGADSSGMDPVLYSRIREVTGRLTIAFLGMECDGAPLTWLYGPLFCQPVSRQMSRSRKLSGSNADQALEIVKRLGCTDVYVYAMGREPWLQHLMATNYTEGCYQLQQTAEFERVARDNGIAVRHLNGSEDLLVGGPGR
jgi:L-ascorbate metabolism protein UlaG (beta-lactamase superfamily)